MIRNRKIALQDKNQVVFDTFTDIPDTLLVNHIPEILPCGSKYETYGFNDILITADGYAQLEPAGYKSLAVIESYCTNCKIVATVPSTSYISGTYDRNFAIIFRHNSTTFWRFAYIKGDSTPKMYLDATLVAQSAITVELSVPMTLVVELDGQSITGTVINSLGAKASITVNDTTNLSETKHGFYLYRDIYDRFTDFEITRF